MSRVACSGPCTFDSGDFQVAVLAQGFKCSQDIAGIVENSGCSHKIDDSTMIPTIFALHLQGKRINIQRSERER